MTTSAIDYSMYVYDVYYDNGTRYGVNYQSNWVIVPMMLQPDKISTDKTKTKLYNLETDFEWGAIDEDTELTVQFSRYATIVTTQVDGTVAITPAWTTDNKRVISNDRKPLTHVFEIGENDDERISYAVIAVEPKSSIDDNSDEAEVYNAWFAHVGDNAADSGDVYLDRAASPKITADQPVTAWHIRQLNIESQNALLTRCLASFSVPMFGDGWVIVIV